jgi:hypothetical protein
MKKTLSFLCAAAIVAAIGSFIACTAPAADAKNEVTPTTTAVPKPGKAKTTTVTVPISAYADPEAADRHIDFVYGKLHLDYFELYFRNTDVASGSQYEDDNDGDVFFAKAAKGASAISISIPSIPAGQSLHYDVLLLGGKITEGGAVLLANAYSPHFEIVEGTQNTITLNVQYLSSRMRLYTKNLSTEVIDGNKVINFDERTGGTKGIGDFAAQRLPAGEATTTLTLYPQYLATGLGPLYDAWGTAAATLGGGWVGTAKYWLDALGTAAENQWSTKRISAAFTTLTPASPKTPTSHADDDTFLFQPAAPITVIEGTGGSATIKNVLNTFGRLYAVIPVHPFGSAGQGVTWSIQGGGVNYYILTGIQGSYEYGAYGGILFAFGGSGTNTGAADETAGLPLSDLAQIAEDEQTAINIVLSGAD